MFLQGNTTIFNEYEPTNRAAKYMRQKVIELQGEIDKPSLIVGDFNTPYQKWTDPAVRSQLRM